MKLIPLTQGKFAMVDDKDFEELNQFKWCALRSAQTWYALRRLPPLHGKQRTIRMHTAITGYAMTDHVDGCGLNNRRGNLREASRAENNRNTRARRGCSSRYKGVSYHQGRGERRPWRSFVGTRYTRRFLGYFASEEEAALAYDAAARELFGPFAALNFPGPGERSALTGELVTS